MKGTHRKETRHKGASCEVTIQPSRIDKVDALSAITGFPAVKLGASVTAFGHAAAEEDFESVRDEIQQAIVRGDATSVAVAVVHGERIVWEEGFGWANREASLEAS